MSAPAVPCFFEFAFEGGELIFVDELLFVEEPADQRRFAVVHRTAGQKAQSRESRLALWRGALLENFDFDGFVH